LPFLFQPSLCCNDGEDVTNAPTPTSTYAKKHKELNKARENTKKKCTATFKKMTSKWSESDKLVRLLHSVYLTHTLISSYSAL
jgi:structural maintenance of chromosomes protein 5